MHPILGMTPLLLDKEGVTYLKRTKLRSGSHHMRSGGFPGAERWPWLPTLKELRHAGPHPVGCSNNYHASFAQKVPEHQTLKPFKSGLRDFLPFNTHE
jgi:hypothetical protein